MQHLYRYLLRNSPSPDGYEFADKAPDAKLPDSDFELGIHVSFCHPRSPWLVLTTSVSAVIFGIMKAIYQIGFGGETDKTL